MKRAVMSRVGNELMRDSALKPVDARNAVADRLSVGNELMRDSALKPCHLDLCEGRGRSVGNELMRDSALKRAIPDPQSAR